MVSVRCAVILALVVLGGWARAEAITVYPIDRAEILAGSRFDLKIEFDRIIPPSQARVTINGEEHTTVLGQAGRFVPKEDGAEASAAPGHRGRVRGQWELALSLGRRAG